MTARETFHKNFLALYQAKGCAQIELAEAIGVSRPTVSAWVRGKAFPRADELDRLAKFFAVDLNRLLCYLGQDEQYLLEVYRGANDQAQRDAVRILEGNQKQDTVSVKMA